MESEHKHPYTYCKECNQEFDNSFNLIDHLLEDDEDFDPYLILPNGFKLMVGSLLRFLYNHSHEPDQIELISQSVYVTLFASEMGYEPIAGLIEDMVVTTEMQNIDEQLQELLKGEGDGGVSDKQKD